DVLKDCQECSIVNRKRISGFKFVQSSKVNERVPFDILNLNSFGQIVLIGIDYFSRYVNMSCIDDRKPETIIKAIEKMYGENFCPKIIVTDNAKEFSGNFLNFD
ncbi:hypothetical protein COBT_002895, partial [Conglomerata obtusa]